VKEDDVLNEVNRQSGKGRKEKRMKTRRKYKGIKQKNQVL
jgi:hypothetical protein